MRDIEFRYWYKGKLYPALTLVEMVHNGEFEGTDIADCIVMQYTGLDAKNGRIFEGDIIKWRGYEVKESKQIRPERKRIIGKDWILDCYALHCLLSNDTEIEVIGNIYENSELIDKGGI